MSIRWMALALLLGSGCDQVLGLQVRDAMEADARADANTEGHDEDRDGIPDDDDNCPSLANPQQLTEGDEKVGVVCDPHPGAPGDQIVREVSAYFVAGLEPYSGFGWIRSGDAAVTTAPVDTTDASLRVSLMGSPRTSLTVAIVLTVRELGLPNENAIEIDLTIGTGSYLCSIREEGISSANSVGMFTGSNLTSGTFFPPAVSLDVPHQLTVEIDPTSPTCDFDGRRESSAVGNVLAGDVSIVVRARKMKVELGSVVVYDTP